MSEDSTVLRRVVSAGGIYALAALAQRGLAFFLLPIYTRLIDPVEFGTLELLTAFSTIAFGILMMGLPSAILKCYHRDCATEGEQARLLSTAFGIAVPVLCLGAGALSLVAPELSRLLLGRASDATLVRLVLATGVLSSLVAMMLANLRAREQAVTFSILTLVQFSSALVFNLVLVVQYQMGVRGVLWGNLASYAVALPVALFLVRRGTRLGFDRRLLRAMLHFGLLLVPVVFTGWVINLSDRYMLRLFSDLAEVAVYGVGYKFGMIIELVVVWPFQLAWPAIAFSITAQADHRGTYSQTLTYLGTLLAYLVVALSLLTRLGIPVIVGAGYQDAYIVVPWVALAYALNGVQFCASPGLHNSRKTHYLTYVSVAAAVLNVALNLLLIPRFGMSGAAWATAASFFLIAAVTVALSARYYSVAYEYRRLLHLSALALFTFFVGAQVEADLSATSILWHLFMAVFAFPVMLLLTGFVRHSERRLILQQLRRLAWPTARP